MKPTFDEATPGYYDLFESCIITANQLPEVDRIIDRIKLGQPQYLLVERATSVPWYVVALIHSLECDLNFREHLHNGDSLDNYTKDEPAGRPQVGHGPPFAWLESAIDAIQYDRLDEFTNWDVARICYECESFNGWGYRGYGINSPYLWAGCQHYTAGKYIADGVFSATAVSDQIGAAVLLRRMVDTDFVELKADTES
jgi:lysozyme family protein